MIIPNPCKGICQIHKDYKICIGCFRSQLERKLWNIASDNVKLEILENCERKKEIYGDLNVQ